MSDVMALGICVQLCGVHTTVLEWQALFFETERG